MTDIQIDGLIHVAQICAEMERPSGVAAICEVLRDVPIGQRPDVDALLARTPNNVQYVIVARNHILAEAQS